MAAHRSPVQLYIAPQSSCVVGDLVFAAKLQDPLDDTNRHLFTITFTIAVLLQGVIEWASTEKDEPFGRPPNHWPMCEHLGALKIVLVLTTGTEDYLRTGKKKPALVLILLGLRSVFQAANSVVRKLSRNGG
jgi:hypothetical protein